MSTAQRADARRNRERLVTAAGEVVAEHGVDAPLAAVARRAGVSIGTLYNHFPDRAALLAEVMPERLAELDRLTVAALADPDPWEGFAGFLRQSFALQARDRGINDAALRRSLAGPGVIESCGNAGRVVDAVIERARDHGVLRADFEPRDLDTLIQVIAHLIASTESTSTAWSRHLEVVLDGLRTR